MGKALGVIVLIAAIAAGVVFGVPSVRAKVLGVPLKMQFKAGAETKMKMTLDGKVKVEVSGLPDNMLPKEAQAFFNTDIPFNMEMRTRQVVKSVNGDTADVETTVEGGTMELKLPNSPQPLKQPIPAGQPSVVKMDAQGRVKLDASTPPPPGMSADDMKKVQEFISNMSGGFLPGDTKRVGQSWSQDVSLPINADKVKVTISGNITNTFEGVDKKNNVNVADIAGKQDIKVEVSGSQPGVDIKLVGGVQGNNHGYFDWSAGQIVGTDGTAKLDLTLNVKADKPQAIDAKAHLTGDVKVTLEKL